MIGWLFLTQSSVIGWLFLLIVCDWPAVWLAHYHCLLWLARCFLTLVWDWLLSSYNRLWLASCLTGPSSPSPSCQTRLSPSAASSPSNPSASPNLLSRWWVQIPPPIHFHFTYLSFVNISSLNNKYYFLFFQVFFSGARVAWLCAHYGRFCRGRDYTLYQANRSNSIDWLLRQLMTSNVLLIINLINWII